MQILHLWAVGRASPGNPLVTVKIRLKIRSRTLENPLFDLFGGICLNFHRKPCKSSKSRGLESKIARKHFQTHPYEAQNENLPHCSISYIYLSIYLSIHLSIHPSFYLSIRPSVHPSTGLRFKNLNHCCMGSRTTSAIVNPKFGPVQPQSLSDHLTFFHGISRSKRKGTTVTSIMHGHIDCTWLYNDFSSRIHSHMGHKVHHLWCPRSKKTLVGGLNPSEKYDCVDWDDESNPIFSWENAKLMATIHHQPDGP